MVILRAGWTYSTDIWNLEAMVCSPTYSIHASFANLNVMQALGSF